jgi:septal ring factor EnvC (AmiA/AmiB activator)
MIETINKPGITIAHILTTVGLLGGLLAYANSTENKVVEQEAKQQTIIKNQDEIKQDFKDYQTEQRQVQTQQMQLLHQIKGRLENNQN